MTAAIQVVAPANTKTKKNVAAVQTLWQKTDEQFSPFKPQSELSRLNRGEIEPTQLSPTMKKVLAESEKTQQLTDGFFNITRPDGKIDPSGLVKGWAIERAAQLLRRRGYRSFYLEIAGDIRVAGHNDDRQKWRVGIRNPHNKEEIIKVLTVSNVGVATSGAYEQGDHIYNPHSAKKPDELSSVTIIGPGIDYADRLATAVFAMGRRGLEFIQNQKGFAAYAVTAKGRALFTPNFEQFVVRTVQTR